jgi:hypothetical protein
MAMVEQELEHDLVERFGHLQVRHVTAAGEDDPLGAGDGGLDGAAVGVHIGDVVLASDEQGRHGDLAQPLEGGPLGHALQPGARFVTSSLLDAELPACVAATAIRNA